MERARTAEQARFDDADRDLLARCRRGEKAAFREVYQLHRASVFGVVARMLSNDADREEVVQDVFLQIFKSLPAFKGDSKLSTWIHRVAVNVTLQHIRRKGRRIRLQLREQAPEIDPDIERGPVSNPEGDAMLGERRDAVRRALDALAPKKRIALVLADFEGRSSSEIAEIVGAPALTVRTRLFYARREFYRRLSREPSFEEIELEREER
ncbi:MAG: sigma-70 family RNA polymerase sigma factor [Polyangia bacterium]